MKCSVKDCENHSHQGDFVGLLCAPCHNFISGGAGIYSQASRDMRSMIDAVVAKESEARMRAQVEIERLKARLAKSGMETRSAVLEEREACAKICHEFGVNQKSGTALGLAVAIRARSGKS